MRPTTLALVLFAAGPMAAEAATFTPGFNTPSFPGSQYDVTAVENAYYSVTYGISVSNAYLYKDIRDTFDGVGIANGQLAGIGAANQAARIDFLDTTDFVAVDYLAILSGVYSAFDSLGNLVDSFAADGTGIVGGLTGTQTLSGGIISYITFKGNGGYMALSGLTYNYDGTTDGHNDDLPGVPLPAGGLLLLGGLGALAGLRRHKN